MVFNKISELANELSVCTKNIWFCRRMWAFSNPLSMFEVPKIFKYGSCSGIWAHACAIIEWGETDVYF